MGYKEEFIVSPKISIGTFPRNIPTDFRYILDTEHTHRFHNVGFRVRKVLLSFEKVHYNATTKPSIILSSGIKRHIEMKSEPYHSNDYLMLINDDSVSSTRVNLGDIKSGANGQYLVITSRYLNRRRFMSDVEESLNALGASNVAISQEESGIHYLTGYKSEDERVFFSSDFLHLFGFTDRQLSKIPTLILGPDNDNFFSSQDVINITPHGRYCEFISPPEFLNVFSPNLSDNTHDSDINNPAKICEILNKDRKYKRVQRFRDPEWIKADRISAGVIHILVQSARGEISNTSPCLKSIILHIEINTDENLMMMKSIFFELKSDYNGDSQDYYVFLAELTRPITINSEDRICVKSIRIPTFSTVFDEHKIFRIQRKTLHGIENKNIEMKDSYFETEEEFIRSLNKIFTHELLHFTLENSRVKISNRSITDAIVIKCSRGMMDVLGRHAKEGDSSLGIRNNTDYTFELQCDIFKLTPSVLTITPTFLCAKSVRDTVANEKHITFFEGKTCQVVSFDDDYEHEAGFFSYVQILIRNPLRDKFVFCNNMIYCSIHIK